MKIITQIITKASDVMLESLTARDALRLCFQQDWNTRSQVLHCPDDAGMIVTVRFEMEAPMTVARQVLTELMKEEDKLENHGTTTL